MFFQKEIKTQFCFFNSWY